MSYRAPSTKSGGGGGPRRETSGYGGGDEYDAEYDDAVSDDPHADEDGAGEEFDDEAKKGWKIGLCSTVSSHCGDVVYHCLCGPCTSEWRGGEKLEGPEGRAGEGRRREGRREEEKDRTLEKGTELTPHPDKPNSLHPQRPPCRQQRLLLLRARHSLLLLCQPVPALVPLLRGHVLPRDGRDGEQDHARGPLQPQGDAVLHQPVRVPALLLHAQPARRGDGRHLRERARGRGHALVCPPPPTPHPRF